MNLPKGVIVNAVWRCKRGHERPAAWTQMELDGVMLAYPHVINRVSAFTINLLDGTSYDICINCLIEDYATERIDFKEG